MSKALPLFFLPRSSEYDFIRLDYEMIFHYYLLYRLTAETAVSEELRGFCSGSCRLGAGGANKCQLLLRMPPETVSITVPSAVTLPVPTLSKKPVVGLIDHKSIVIPGAYPARLGKERGGPGW